ncbi:hypothetical protein D3C83_07390 [compost metagenome]
MLLVGVHLQHVARQAVAVRAVAQGAQARQRLGAKVFDFLARHRLGHVAEGLERARARHQQVAADQMGKAEVGMRREQRLDALGREPQAVFLDRLQYAGERLVRTGSETGRGGEEQGGGQARGAARHRDQFPTLSCWISQRPSTFASTSVLAVWAPLRTSEL